MSLDSYVTLGRSGLRVSPFCLGAMTFGAGWDWSCAPEQSEAIMNRYMELGGNFIDTANIYTRGQSEEIIGHYMNQDKSRRDRMVISTKFAANMYPTDPNGGGAGSKNIIQSCEQSLRRLRTDYIDLYWLHLYDPHTPIEETMRTLEQLVQSGKVRYIGISDTPAWLVSRAQTIAQFRGWSPLIALQIEYNLLERSVEEELIPMARELGLGVIPWSPLRNGMLSGKYTRSTNEVEGRAKQFGMSFGDREYDLIDELIHIGNNHNTTAAAIALAWVKLNTQVNSLLLGVRSTKQLEDNLQALDITLTEEEVSKLNSLSQPNRSFIANFINTESSNSILQSGTTVNGVSSHSFFIHG
ncbi:L-glyceraldehyde 3-phosphate reductase [compost metagenome]